MPTAPTKTSASTVEPPASVSTQWLASSSQRASTISAPSRMCGPSPYLSTQCCMYSRISGWRAQVRVQSSFCSNVKE
jgi:hypothetical protein